MSWIPFQLGSPSQAQWNCGRWWEGGWQFPGTWRSLSHLLYFSQWLLSLEGSGQVFRSPLPRRMLAKQLQPVIALSTVEGGNSINFLPCLQQNMSSISITEETLKSLARLPQTLKLSLPVFRSVRIHYMGENWVLKSFSVGVGKDRHSKEMKVISRGSPLLLQ